MRKKLFFATIILLNNLLSSTTNSDYVSDPDCKHCNNPNRHPYFIKDESGTMRLNPQNKEARVFIT
jgi:hypothetical protein